MKTKDVLNLGNITKEAKEKKFQEETKKKLVEWQIENEVIIQPIIQPGIDRLQATFIFVKAENEQLNALKQSLNLMK